MPSPICHVFGMNYSAASSGVSQGTEIIEAASGGELDPSLRVAHFFINGSGFFDEL
jgi:hypothetical protein